MTRSLLLVALLLVGCGADDADLGVRRTRWFSLPPDGPRLPTPRSLTLGPGGELVALDTAGRVVVMDAAGAALRSWAMPDHAVGNPEGVRWLRDGRIAVCDTHYHQVVFFDAAGKLLEIRGKQGAGPGEYEYPVAIEEDAAGNLYIGEYGGNDRIQKYAPDGALLATIGSPGTGPGQLQRPSGLAWADGVLYVADAINNRILAYRDDGSFIGEVGDASLGWNFPYDIKCGPDGDLWVVEYGAGRVTRITTDGRLRGRFGSPGMDAAQLRTPWGLAVSRAAVYVADTGNRRVVVLDR